MADLIVINKADGDNLKKADLAKREYENALHLFPAITQRLVPESDDCFSYSKTKDLKKFGKILKNFFNKQKPISFLSKTGRSRLYLF